MQKKINIFACMKNELSQREKIVIEFLALSGSRSWRECYAMSRDKFVDPGDVHPVTLSKWKNSKIVQDYFNTVLFRHNQEIKNEIQNAIKQERQKEEEKQPSPSNKNVTSQEIDFTDRNQFIKYLNQAVNGLQDDKQKTDYLKMLSDLLRFKESETGQENEIQRFYTPLTCQNCALYRQEQQK